MRKRTKEAIVHWIDACQLHALAKNISSEFETLLTCEASLASFRGGFQLVRESSIFLGMESFSLNYEVAWQEIARVTSCHVKLDTAHECQVAGATVSVDMCSRWLSSFHRRLICNSCKLCHGLLSPSNAIHMGSHKP